MFPAGSTIEVKIKNSRGEVISEWHSLNSHPATTILATFTDVTQTIAVTDDAGNTYENVPVCRCGHPRTQHVIEWDDDDDCLAPNCRCIAYVERRQP